MELRFCHGKSFHVQIGLIELPKERVVKISIVLVFQLIGNPFFSLPRIHYNRKKTLSSLL